MVKNIIAVALIALGTFALGILSAALYFHWPI